LRERPGDIAALAAHFAAKHARANGHKVPELDPVALARLQAHHWRGNARELENCLHRAVLLCQGERITPAEIVLGGRAEPPVESRTDSTRAGGAAPVGRSLAEVECHLILDTLGHTFGNRTHAATMLGISIRTLRNKLKQYSEAGLAIPASTAPASAGGAG
jgi:DNA-binding NtrC family response regulator